MVAPQIRFPVVGGCLPPHRQSLLRILSTCWTAFAIETHRMTRVIGHSFFLQVGRPKGVAGSGMTNEPVVAPRTAGEPYGEGASFPRLYKSFWQVAGATTPGERLWILPLARKCCLSSDFSCRSTLQAPPSRGTQPLVSPCRSRSGPNPDQGICLPLVATLSCLFLLRKNQDRVSPWNNFALYHVFFLLSRAGC